MTRTNQSPMQLPAKFINRYQKFIPDFDRFLKALDTPLRSVIRINTLKGEKEEILRLLSDFKLEPIPWYDLAYRVKNNIQIGNRLEYFLGLIYVQEAASMIPPLVLDPQPGEKVLDLTAAPGSKTTQIASMMKNTGLIVANDVNRKRIRALLTNIERYGALNVVVTNKRGERIGEFLAGYFDRVLLDAPCSLEGMLRKNDHALTRWSESNILRSSMIQKSLLVSAFKALKPEGILVYSTCTFAPEENEAVVSFLLEQYPDACIEPFTLPGLITHPALTHWQRTRFHPDVLKTSRIYPHDNNTEGFFIAKIKKAAVK